MSIASNSTVIILGSTGSIGTQGLDVISRHPERFTVTGLAAGGAHIELLAQQAAQFHVSEVAVFDETKVPALQAALAQAGAQGVRVTGGPDSVIAMAGSGANVVLNGITGSIGLEPSIAALKAGSQLALANKESVVAGGHLLFSAQEPNQPGRFRAFRHLAIPALRNPRRSRQACGHRLRRTVPRLETCRHGEHHSRAGAASSDVEHGAGCHHQLLHTDEQGPRSHRGVPLVQRAA